MRWRVRNIFLTTAMSLVMTVSQTMHAHAMDLKDALANAYRENPQLEAARDAVRVADEDVARAMSGWRPNLSANYVREREGVSVNNASRTTRWSHTEAVNLQQPIFNGGETVSAVERAREAVNAQRAALTDTEQQIMLEAAIAYVDVVRARTVLDLARKNEGVLTKHQNATKERFDVGEVTRTDTAQSDSRLARAISDRVQAEGDVTIAEATFERVVRMPPPEQADLPAMPVWEPENLDEVVQLALKQNPQLLQAVANSNVAEATIGEAKAQLLPDVSLNGSMRRETGLLFLNNSGKIENDSISLNVNVPLYQSGAEYANIRRAKKQYHQAQSEAKNARNTVVELVAQRWKQLQVSRATIEANEEAIRAAKVALSGVKQEYDYGARTTLDVLDAEQELFEAQVNLITAKRNALVAHYNLAALAGRFTAGALDLDVALYQPEEHYKNTQYKILGF